MWQRPQEAFRGTLTSIPTRLDTGKVTAGPLLSFTRNHVTAGPEFCVLTWAGGAVCIWQPHTTQVAGWHGSLQRQTLLTVTGLQGKL